MGDGGAGGSPHGGGNGAPGASPAEGRVARVYEALRHDGLFWRRFAYEGATRAPEWFRRRAPDVFGTLFFAARPRERSVVREYQARLLAQPENSAAVLSAAHSVFVEYAHCLTDALEFAGRPERPFAHDVRGQVNFDRARALGRGVIIVTAHTGSWEVGGQMLALDRDVRTTMVMAEESNAGARAYADGLRRRGKVDVLYARGHDPSTALTLLARLRAREVVAIQIDRAPASATVVDTRLAGAPFAVPEGPFRLAQGSGAPIVPVFVRRAGYRSYVLEVEPAIVVERAGGRAAVERAAQGAVDSLERFVRAHPHQWFHFVRG